jgi:hypothetical protein
MDSIHGYFPEKQVFLVGILYLAYALENDYFSNF